MRFIGAPREDSHLGAMNALDNYSERTVIYLGLVRQLSRLPKSDPEGSKVLLVHVFVSFDNRRAFRKVILRRLQAC